MHYPWWYVPGLTAPMLIAVIAVVHVLVSHYAVGGGILIALENQFAVKHGDRDYRDYWFKHARFFVLLTVAFGAITGVGIWWTIALASPLATEMLIRTFVFGWAIEWVFFIVEIVAAFLMYYFWTKLPEKTHVVVAWIYAAAAWISLVLITGITAFMLDSRGMIADWKDSGNFWHAFFNIQFLPQTIVRTGGAVLLAALYVFLHAAWTFRPRASRDGGDPANAELLEKVVRRMTKPLIFGAVTLALGVAWWFATLSPRILLTMERAVLLNVLLTIFFGLCALLTFLVVLGPMRNPRSINLGFAVCLFIFGMMALASAEFIREAVRKPWIVDQVVLGNQIYADEITDRQTGGFLREAPWQTIPEEKIQRGGMLFMYHCNNCHAADHGMSAAGPLLAGLDKKQIVAKLRKLDEPVFSMPPWCGNEDELDALAEFLLTVRPDNPGR